MTPSPAPPGDVAAPTNPVPLVTLERLAVGYDRQPIVSGLNAQILTGTFTGLLGTNGSGKSTLLKTLLGILPPVAGRVLARPGLVFGYVPQRESLDAVYLVSSLEVVLMGACGRVRPGRPLGHAEKDFARHCLAEVGAADVTDRRFAQLSGGQKQRVLIARALATRPGLLVLDEPTAGIDAAATQSILELLTRLNREQHLAILMVNHDLPAVRRTVQRVLWIHHGELLQGSVEELLSRQRVEELMELGL